MKRKIEEAEERDQISMLTKAIADRRQRDLSDIVSEQESLVGWEKVVHFLHEAVSSTYLLSFGMSPEGVPLEPLKYREILFGLLGCSGLEPTDIDTSEVLDVAADEDSLIDASHSVLRSILTVAQEQVANGDILFFGTDAIDSAIPQALVDRIMDIMKQQSRDVRVVERDGELDVSALWYTRGGLQVLSQLGVKGTVIDHDTLDVLLSVIQPPLSQTTPLRMEEGNNIVSSEFPTNDDYKQLLICIRDHNVDLMKSLGSQQAFPVMKAILDEAVSRYDKTESSEDYRHLLQVMGVHVRVRSLDSIPALNQLCHHSETRVASSAVVALASFYHESAAHVLGRHLCSARNSSMIDTLSNAILSIGHRCPEVNTVLQDLESTDCGRPARISRILKRIDRHQYKYYL
jgi:hypothetical protein